MADFEESVFWPEFRAAGFLKAATVTSDGSTFAIDVDFAQPNRDRFGGGVTSSEYEIEYQYGDAPVLKEGDPVVIDGVSYYVRQPPYVADQGNASGGYFRRALLSKGAGQGGGTDATVYRITSDGSIRITSTGDARIPA